MGAAYISRCPELPHAPASLQKASQKSLLPFPRLSAFGCQDQRQLSSETGATAVNLKQIFFISNATAGQLNRKE